MESPKNAKEVPPGAVFGQDNWRGWIEQSKHSLGASGTGSLEFNAPDTGVSQSKAENTSGTDRASPLFQPIQWTRARHSVTEWTLLSRCPRAYEWTFIRPAPNPKLNDPAELPLGTSIASETLLEQNFVLQSEIGTRVHACLENGDPAGLRALELEVGAERFSAEPVIQWATNSPWMAPAQVEKGRDVWKELSFEVPFGKEVLVGSIDRLILETENEEPMYTLIDFKVSEKSKSPRSLVETYRTQIELYAWAVTALDPSISLKNMRAYLVHISGATVQTASIPLGQLNLNRIVDAAVEVIQGTPGVPKPGYMCRYCDFRSQCPEGIASLNSINII